MEVRLLSRRWALALVLCLVAASPLAAPLAVQPAIASVRGQGLLHVSRVPVPEASFQNVILMIGDGMGWGQLNATRKSMGSVLAVDTFPWSGEVDTYSLDNPVTDSAAAATALATGQRTNNYRVSMTPAGVILATVLELAESLGKSTGLVTTTRVTHATPAAFAAHVPDRNLEGEIGRQIVVEHDVEVLLGGGQDILATYLSEAQAKGYVLVEDRNELLNSTAAGKLLGVFAAGFMSYDAERNPLVDPHLREMVNVSLRILSRNAGGFFLMVEGGRIDNACHNHDITNTIGDTRAFDEAVEAALEFAQLDGQTLLIVTADHETGGLVVNSTSPELDYEWTAASHTGAKVPAFVYCANLSMVPTFTHLTDIGGFLFEAISPVPEPPVWTQLPTSQTIEFGDRFSYDLNVTTSVGVDSWWTNDSLHFGVDQAGVVSNASVLSVGRYGLQVWVNDTVGNTLLGAFAVLVRDSTPPGWIVAPTDQVLRPGEPLDCRLAAWDLSGIGRWVVNDTHHFAITGDGRLTNATRLDPGCYGATVEIYDLYENMVSGTFKVTVQDQATTPLPPPTDPRIFGIWIVVIGLSLSVVAWLLLARRRKSRQQFLKGASDEC